MRVQALGFRGLGVKGLGVRGQGSGFRVSGFRGLGFGVQGRAGRTTEMASSQMFACSPTKYYRV